MQLVNHTPVSHPKPVCSITALKLSEIFVRRVGMADPFASSRFYDSVSMETGSPTSAFSASEWISAAPYSKPLSNA